MCFLCLGFIDRVLEKERHFQLELVGRLMLGTVQVDYYLRLDSDGMGTDTLYTKMAAPGRVRRARGVYRTKAPGYDRSLPWSACRTWRITIRSGMLMPKLCASGSCG